MSTVVQKSAFEEIQENLNKNIVGRLTLEILTAFKRLDFLLRFAVWILRAASISMDLILIVASPIIMVSVASPSFDAHHPSGLYTWASGALITAADILVPGGLFATIDKFWHKQYAWGWILGFFWLILTCLTFYVLSTPMHVTALKETQLQQILYFRTIDSLIYSALSLVAAANMARTQQKKEPTLTPVQEDIIVKLHEQVNSLSTIIHNQQAINYEKIAQELQPLLPLNSGIKSEQLTGELKALEDRFLQHIEEQITHVITLINSPVIMPEILEKKEPEIMPEKEAEFTPQISDEIPPEIVEEKEAEFMPEFTPEKGPEIPPQILEKKVTKKEPEIIDCWEEVIVKFPGVIEWQQDDLRSVSIDQIMKVTGYTKHKISRAELAQVKGGNKKIKSVLNWLKKEPGIVPQKSIEKSDENNAQILEEITHEIMPEFTPEIAEEKEAEFTAEITHEIDAEFTPENKEKNTGELDAIPSAKLPRITRQLSMSDDWQIEKNTDPEIESINA